MVDTIVTPAARGVLPADEGSKIHSPPRGGINRPVLSGSFDVVVRWSSPHSQPRALRHRWTFPAPVTKSTPRLHREGNEALHARCGLTWIPHGIPGATTAALRSGSRAKGVAGALGLTLPVGISKLEIEVEHRRPLRITEGASGATSWGGQAAVGRGVAGKPRRGLREVRK